MEKKDISEIVTAVEAKFGRLKFFKDQKDDFSIYTAKINRKFWDEVKVTCTRNGVSLTEFMYTAFSLYYAFLNGNLPDSMQNDLTSDQKFEDVKELISDVKTQNEELSKDMDKLSTQFQTVISLFSGRLSNGN